MFFTSNIQFEKESGYFDIGAQMKPLLHILVARGRRAVLHSVSVAAGGTQPICAALHGTHPTWPVDRFVRGECLDGLPDSDGGILPAAVPRLGTCFLAPLLAFNVIPRPVRPVVREALAALGIVLIALAVFGFTRPYPVSRPGGLATLSRRGLW